MKKRDPSWRWRRALGHKIVRDKTRYTRKSKHKARRNAGSFFVSLVNGRRTPLGHQIVKFVCCRHQAMLGQ